MMAWMPPAIETTRAIAAARKSGATMKQSSTPTTMTATWARVKKNGVRVSPSE